MDDKVELEELIAALPAALEQILVDLGINNAKAVRIAREAGMGITEGTLSKWHAGKQIPSVPNLIRYLGALGKNLCELHIQMRKCIGADDSTASSTFDSLDNLFVPTTEESRKHLEEYARRTDLEAMAREIQELREQLTRIQRGGLK